MVAPLRMDARPVLKALEKPNNPRATGWKITPFSGDRGWRCVHVQKLSPEDGGGNHSVYIDVINEDGQRIAKPNVLVEFGFGSGNSIAYFEKPQWEPNANFVIGAGVNAHCLIKGNFPSDLVRNLQGENGHTCYYLVFQFCEGDTKPESNIEKIKRLFAELKPLIEGL